MAWRRAATVAATAASVHARAAAHSRVEVFDTSDVPGTQKTEELGTSRPLAANGRQLPPGCRRWLSKAAGRCLPHQPVWWVRLDATEVHAYVVLDFRRGFGLQGAPRRRVCRA